MGLLLEYMLTLQLNNSSTFIQSVVMSHCSDEVEVVVPCKFRKVDHD